MALLVATAIAPTDPGVVISVLGLREPHGRSGTVLEGESGANDPVGIALMTSLIAAGGLGAKAFGVEFLLQMVGGVVGLVARRAPSAAVRASRIGTLSSLSDEPQGVPRFTVERGAPADGRWRRLADLTELSEHAWISLVVRDRSLVQVRGTTVLQQGDEVMVLSDADFAGGDVG